MTEPPKTVKLRDGRTLSYEVYGDPEGKPVLYFHGYPGSRLEPALVSKAATKYAARLIAIDRPGFGHSTFKPGRRILDWPDDVSGFADLLGLDRFAAMGVSGGGPYAAACAYRIPERLTQVAMVCGVGPFDAPNATDGMMLTNRILFLVARYSQTLVRLLMLPMTRALRKDPERALEMLLKRLPEPDREALSREGVSAVFAAGALEALRQGTRAAGLEGQLYSRSWGFRLEDVAREVHLFQGELDVNVPPAMGRYQAQALPRCHPRFYADEAHLSLVLNQADDILRALTAD